MPCRPSAALFFNWLRLANGPLALRNATIFSLIVPFSPETCFNNAADAVLTSTPTALTQSSTTVSSMRAKCDWLTSCWYWPTPMDLGSILTNSANGSCNRRAIDTAPRSETSRLGNSLAASSEAEYTEAPASDTTIFWKCNSGWLLIKSATS